MPNYQRGNKLIYRFLQRFYPYNSRIFLDRKNVTESLFKRYMFLLTEKPSAPEGPIVFSEINKTTVTMSWQPPKSDGGSPLKHYIIESKELTGVRWTETGKVKPDITSYTAQKLKTQKEYVFRIIAENSVGKSEPLTSETVVPKSPFGKS